MISKRKNRVFGLAAICATLLAVACGGDSTEPSGPQPGQLSVSLSTTGAGGAAFLLKVTGNDITDPVAGSASHSVFTYASGNTVTAAVVAPSAVTSGTLLKFSVPDVNQASSYRVSLDQVAGSDNLLMSGSEFTVSITR